MTPAALIAALIVLIGLRLPLAPPARRPGRRPHVSLPTTRRAPRSERHWPGRWPATRVEPGEVADWCDRLARATRGGSTLSAAVRATAPPSACTDELEAIVLRLDRGSSLGDAIGDAISGPGSGRDDLDLALTVLHACAEHGGVAAEPLDRVAAALRGRAADRADRRVQSAPARLSALVMTLLPAAMLLVLLATSASVRRVTLLPSGLAMLAAGAVLNLTGWWWMRRVIGRGVG